MLLALVVAALAFLAWLTVARLRRLSAVVLAALLAVALGTVALAAVQPRAAVESRVLLFLGVAATLLIARKAQSRRPTGGDREQATDAGSEADSAGDGRDGSDADRDSDTDGRGGRRLRRWPYRITVGLALVIALGCFPLGALARNEDGFVPSVRELGPLPDDLAVRGRGLDQECGQGGCAVSYIVAGRPGEPAEQVAGRMWDHLADEGWPAADGGRTCRPVGWLLDNRETCVWISTQEGVARLILSGGRPYPRYNELRYSGP